MLDKTAGFTLLTTTFYVIELEFGTKSHKLTGAPFDTYKHYLKYITYPETESAVSFVLFFKQTGQILWGGNVSSNSDCKKYIIMKITRWAVKIY